MLKISCFWGGPSDKHKECSFRPIIRSRCIRPHLLLLRIICRMCEILWPRDGISMFCHCLTVSPGGWLYVLRISCGWSMDCFCIWSLFVPPRVFVIVALLVLFSYFPVCTANDLEWLITMESHRSPDNDVLLAARRLELWFLIIRSRLPVGIQGRGHLYYKVRCLLTTRDTPTRGQCQTCKTSKEGTDEWWKHWLI